MHLVSSHARIGLRVVATLTIGALLLAGCATSQVATTTLSGTPAFSISVPLSSVGCTLNDICVAVGTSSTNVGPSAVAEFSTPKGRWLNLALPSATSPLVTSTACSGSQCLIGGSQPGNDLVWRFVASSHSIVVATAPPGGVGINALTCNELNCDAIDTNAMGIPRLSLSGDDGLTWTHPLSMPWASGDAITSLSCGAVFDCAVSATTSQHHVELYVTRDGGLTWTRRTTPNSWTSLTSMTCQQRSCVALASVGTSSLVVRSTNFTRTWTSVSLRQRANAMACSTLTSCVVVGQHTNATPWLATLSGAAPLTTSLRYVPSPLLNVACGSKVCAAIAVTTVLSMPLALYSGK